MLRRSVRRATGRGYLAPATVAAVWAANPWVGDGLIHNQGGQDDSSLRPDRDGAAAAVRPGSRRSGRGPGADGRTFRRDVDVPQLHVPVVQLPRSPGRAA